MKEQSKFTQKRSSDLIELARKTFSLGEEGNKALLDVPSEITLDNLPFMLDTCPIIKKVYTFRVKLQSLEKVNSSLTDGQKLSLLIDSARGISQLAKILVNNESILNKIKNKSETLTREEEDMLDDLTIALSRILLSNTITVKKRKSRKT